VRSRHCARLHVGFGRQFARRPGDTSPCAVPTPQKTVLTLVALAALAAPAVYAGCLAPSDAVVDGANAVGVFWGNSNGELLYVRNTSGTKELVRRKLGQASEILAQAGTRNDFSVGPNPQTWVDFHSGTLNSDGDMAFVSSTNAADDPATLFNETIARRGVYAQRGNSLFQIGRFGDPSPVRDAIGQPIPWASFFDAVAERRGDLGFARIVFSAQLLESSAPRAGIFRWDQETFDVTPILMVGDFSPAGGTITTLARMRGNENGDVALFAVSQVGEEGPISAALLLVLADGAKLRIVRFGEPGEGDPVPTKGVFSILNDFALADDGTLVFSSTVANGSGSGVYRASPPLYRPEALMEEGGATPIGGSYGSFNAAKVRMAPNGDALIGVRLSDDVGGEGIFSIAAGAFEVVPLANPSSTLGIAAFGGGSGGYQTDTETHAVLPADGSDAGPDDFRVTKLDLKNNVPLRQDAIRFAGAFRLPAAGEGIDEIAPVVIGPGNYERRTPGRRWTGEELTRIQRVHVSVSRSPGNNFVFGFDNTGAGTLTFNLVDQKSPKTKVAKDGSSATWTFATGVGRGKFTLDLARGTYDLKLSQGTINPSFEPAGFRVRLTMQTEADVIAGRDEDGALYHQSHLLAAEEKAFGRGRRIVSRGEGIAGGTLFVDDLLVKRKLKTTKGAAAPTVDSDSIRLEGTLRICLGGTPPGTPGLSASVQVGDLVFENLPMVRRGKTGSRYRYRSGKGEGPAVQLDVDVRKGTFKLTVKGADPLSQLIDADFSGGSATNDSKAEVGGMNVPFSLHVERVYEGAFNVQVRRLKGGKKFQK